MKIVVIGLGSMGKRRIRLIKKYDPTIQIVGVDFNKDRRNSVNKEYNIETFDNLTTSINKYKFDCAFVCTSPLSHYNIINQCLKEGINVFTELNLVTDGYETNISLAKKKDLVLFMSSTFLYREEIKKIKDLVRNANCMLNYSYHVGQYLPDWHPWESYRDFFVKDKRSNGCRELLAIELPWIIDIFGDIENVYTVKNKISNLEIDYNDNYLLIIQHKTGFKGMLALDIISRKAVRNLEVFGENLYINWDGSPTGLYLYDYDKKQDLNIQLYKEIDKLENYSNSIVENAYFNEIQSFFEAVLNGTEPIYNFEDDLKVLKIIDRIEA